MKLTKGIVSREQAVKMAPDYVAFAEGDIDKYGVIEPKFDALRVGQRVLTHVREDGVYLIAKISSVNSNCPQALDGPVVRVSNGEFSWRVDGDAFAWPVK